MEGPHPGGTTLVIMVASEPGKYAYCWFSSPSSIFSKQEARWLNPSHLNRYALADNKFMRTKINSNASSNQRD
jgi:hypothetical protein